MEAKGAELFWPRSDQSQILFSQQLTQTICWYILKMSIDISPDLPPYLVRSRIYNWNICCSPFHLFSTLIIQNLQVFARWTKLVEKLYCKDIWGATRGVIGGKASATTERSSTALHPQTLHYIHCITKPYTASSASPTNPLWCNVQCKETELQWSTNVSGINNKRSRSAREEVCLVTFSLEFLHSPSPN